MGFFFALTARQGTVLVHKGWILITLGPPAIPMRAVATEIETFPFRNGILKSSIVKDLNAVQASLVRHLISTGRIKSGVGADIANPPLV